MTDDQETLWKAVVLLNEGVYKIWALYITWYTWFFGANLIVLSWVFLNKDASTSFIDNRASICGIWVIMNLLGTTTSLMLAFHSYRINGRIRTLLERATPSIPVTAGDILPHDMTTWGGLANAFALIILGSLWVVLYLS